MIAAGFGSILHLYDVASSQMIGELQGHNRAIRSLAFLPNGKRLVSGSDDFTVCIWDTNNLQIVSGPFTEHTDSVSALKASPGGRFLVSAGLDDTVRIWNTETWQSRILFRNTGVVRSIVFSPDGSRLLSGSADGNVRIWEVEGFSDEHAMTNQLEGHDKWVRSAAFSACGTYLISGSDDKTVCIWDLQSKKLVRGPLKHNREVLIVGASPNNERIFSVSQDRFVHVWSKQAGELEYTIGPIETDDQDDISYDKFRPVAFICDGRRVVCGSKSGKIYMQDGSEPTRSLTGHDGAVYSIAFSPDGRLLASGSTNGSLIIWDISTGEMLLSPLKGHYGRVNCITFSPDGTQIASGSEDRTIRLWSSLTGTPVGNPLRGHDDMISSVAFSPGGSHLVSGSEDKTVRIWDVTSGQSIALFQGHTDVVLSVAFSPEGTQVVSGSADTTIRLWNAPVQCLKASQERLKNPEEDDRSLEWDMDKDGWVCDTQGRLLLWVPPDLRSNLLRRHNSGLISRQGCIELDLFKASMGDRWQMCYQPL
ncbi:putative WD repeat-containing protein alr3466 [Nostoc sp, PCC 7120] [Rhizoctonia solani]|uniref:Putative WD repeat-containing protein alr3466 [Nostoc sp, PCC 7120] n=1 Tax=Rhizoctonia solani TaxID=456999 RepID=A0A0K6G355_9AGAM|nr:putative WD repeat-containing protein alr3466 [Nostoc sp, PCC 7120] [Rhizoctonia solani]